jgi:hypothetical protein
MNKTIENSAKTLLGARALKGFRWHWLLYGVAAYFGVRFLYKKGVFPKQTGAALDIMNRGVEYAKHQIGIPAAPETKQPQTQSTVH